MKHYESFGAGWQYTEYLHRQHERGALVAETVDARGRDAMVSQILTDTPEPGVYLEVGPSAEPYFVNSNRPFGRGVSYLGIDGGKSQYIPNRFGESSGWTEFGLKRAESLMRTAITKISAQPNAAAAFMVWGDAQALPLPDREQQTHPIRETFMRDVFLLPGVHPTSMEQVFREQARVLAKDGLLVIRETEYVGFDPGDRVARARFLALLASLEGAGFTQRALVHAHEDIAVDLRARFPGGQDDTPNSGIHDGYYLICGLGERTSRWQRVLAATQQSRLLRKVIRF